jgi:hypothetical protein
MKYRPSYEAVLSITRVHLMSLQNKTKKKIIIKNKGKRKKNFSKDFHINLKSS